MQALQRQLLLTLERYILHQYRNSRWTDKIGKEELRLKFFLKRLLIYFGQSTTLATCSSKCQLRFCFASFYKHLVSITTTDLTQSACSHTKLQRILTHNFAKCSRCLRRSKLWAERGASFLFVNMDVDWPDEVQSKFQDTWVSINFVFFLELNIECSIYSAAFLSVSFFHIKFNKAMSNPRPAGRMQLSWRFCAAQFRFSL